VELLVVISVLGIILAFFVPPIVGRITTNAKRTATQQQLRVLRDAIAGNPEAMSGGELIATGFKNDVGRLPRHLIELATRNPFQGIYTNIMYVGKETLLAWNPYTRRGWNGPYIREDGEMSYLNDAWGVPFRLYTAPGGIGLETLGLESPGPDGIYHGQSGAPPVSDDIRVLF